MNANKKIFYTLVSLGICAALFLNTNILSRNTRYTLVSDPVIPTEKRVESAAQHPPSAQTEVKREEQSGKTANTKNPATPSRVMQADGSKKPRRSTFEMSEDLRKKIDAGIVNIKSRDTEISFQPGQKVYKIEGATLVLGTVSEANEFVRDDPLDTIDISRGMPISLHYPIFRAAKSISRTPPEISRKRPGTE